MIYVLIGIGVIIYIACYIKSVINIMRLSFWKWPNIWYPRSDRSFAVLFSLLGPVSLLVVTLSEERFNWPKIPQEAYKIKRRDISMEDSMEDRALSVMQSRIKSGE